MFYTLFNQIPLPPAKERVFANLCRDFLRYILVKVVEPNPTGRFKRTVKLSKPDMDVRGSWTQYEATCMGMRGESYMRDGLRVFGYLRYSCYTLSPWQRNTV